MRVLLVEDSYDTRESLRIWLKQHGAEVTAVETGAEALELLTTMRPHVLLADIGLPGMSGYALMRRIRSLAVEDGGQVPAAAITAHTSPEDRIAAIDAGFWDHVPKPVDLRLLLAVVLNLVRVGASQPAWTDEVGPRVTTMTYKPDES
jgi:DNA-binding response OmpR family regulator